MNKITDKFINIFKNHKSSGSKESLVYDAWQRFLSREHNVLDLDLVNNCSLKEIKSFFKEQDLNRFNDFNHFIKAEILSNEDLALLRSFFSRVRGDRLSIEFCAQASRSNSLSFYVDFDEDVYHCDSSYSPVNGQMVLPFFASKSKKAVFILQHVTSCDAVYIPEFNFLHRFGHISMENAISNIQKTFKAFINQEFDLTSRKEFGGIVVSHVRPYHFYYDVALALRMLFQENLIEKAKTIVQYAGADFLPVSKIYPALNFEEMTLSHNEVTVLMREQNKFLFQVGVLQNLQRHRNLITGLDKNLIAASKRYKYNQKQKDKYGFLEKSSHVIWIGITGQKRAWIEQVDAQAFLINKLGDKFPDTVVVFDGWTNTFSNTDKFNSSIAEDNLVVEKIESLIHKKIKTCSLVGEHSLTKLKVAQLCKFFIANQGTGSMHVCRMANIKGVVHISNAFYETSLKQHRLDTAIKIPQKFVKDIDSDASRMDLVSYSINEDDFVKFVLPIAEKAFSE